MARTPKRIDETQLSKLPVYERHEDKGFRFAHFFGEDMDLMTSHLPELSPFKITAYDIAKLAVDMNNGEKNTPSRTTIETAITLLHNCATEYERNRRKVTQEQCELADKFIDIGELMKESKILSKKTLIKLLASTSNEKLAKRNTEPNPHPCIFKNGQNGTIGSNGLISQGTFIGHLKNRWE